MKQFVWLAFDLGVRGDFEGMYEFLDGHGAKECGDNVAAFSYEFKADLARELTKELQRAVEFDKRSRVYLIYPEAGKHKGRFLVGKRKAAPWTGFGVTASNEEDVGE
jgi:hypothetical protein